jgi:hypothetical protein
MIYDQIYRYFLIKLFRKLLSTNIAFLKFSLHFLNAVSHIFMQKMKQY